MNKLLALLFFVAAGVCAVNAQPAASSDGMLVRNILDAAGMSSYSLDSVAEFVDGRIVSLNLSNRNFGKDGIKSLPQDFGSLTELTILTLNDNNLTELPVSIGKCTKLVRVEIRDNELIALPGSIGQWDALQELDLRNNDLSSLPIEIGLLRNLVKLQLWGNNLRTLPETIGAMSRLTELYLRGNRIETFPLTIRITKLKYIDTQENKLCAVSPEIDIWLKKLDPKYKSWQKCW